MGIFTKTLNYWIGIKMISEKDSKVIKKIRNGEYLMIRLGEDAFAEIHKINQEEINER